MSIFRIGTSGYSYEDWRGAFYPHNLEVSRFLAYYANFFDAVEIDSTYYRIPKPEVFEALARKVPKNFRFSVKVPRAFTHELQSFLDAIEPFRDCLLPLRGRGLLGCLLAQFPFSFRYSKENLEHLGELVGAVGDMAQVCVEFRHSSWYKPEVYSYLEQRGIGFVNVDLPRLQGLPRPSSTATAPIGYVRFHGRVDVESWWRPKEAHQRYDYEYSEEELMEWLPLIRSLGERCQEVYLMFNNHYKGKAVKAAISIKRLLGPAADEGAKGWRQLRLL